jgi:hypothetical protein
MDLVQWYSDYLRTKLAIRGHLAMIDMEMKRMEALKEELGVRIKNAASQSASESPVFSSAED